MVAIVVSTRCTCTGSVSFSSPIGSETCVTARSASVTPPGMVIASPPIERSIVLASTTWPSAKYSVAGNCTGMRIYSRTCRVSRATETAASKMTRLKTAQTVFSTSVSAWMLNRYGKNAYLTKPNAIPNSTRPMQISCGRAVAVSKWVLSSSDPLSVTLKVPPCGRNSVTTVGLARWKARMVSYTSPQKGRRSPPCNRPPDTCAQNRCAAA